MTESTAKNLILMKNVFRLIEEICEEEDARITNYLEDKDLQQNEKILENILDGVERVSRGIKYELGYVDDAKDILETMIRVAKGEE